MDKITCSSCGHEFVWENEPEIAMTIVACPNCGLAVDQGGSAWAVINGRTTRINGKSTKG